MASLGFSSGVPLLPRPHDEDDDDEPGEKDHLDPVEGLAVDELVWTVRTCPAENVLRPYRFRAAAEG